jgi:hypothetical protein
MSKGWGFLDTCVGRPRVSSLCICIYPTQHVDSGVPAQRPSDRPLAASRRRSMQNPGYELLRTPLLGTWVNSVG